MVSELEKMQFKRVPGPSTRNACLDMGPEGSWYDFGVWSASTLYDGKIYRLWFTGISKSSGKGFPYDQVEQIGMATSSDCLNWKLANEGRPVLGLGPPGSIDQKGLAHPFVLKSGGKYMMWYGAIDGTAGKGTHVRVERLALATSEDGIHWKRANDGLPVMDIGPEGSIDAIQASGMHIKRIGDKFVMWYGGYDTTTEHKIGFATSSDGIHWTRGNDGKAITGLQGKQQLGPSVHYDGNRYYMLYNTELLGGWGLYAATSDDGIHWQPTNNRQPVHSLPPADNFDRGGRGRNFATHPTKFLFSNGKIRFWYGGQYRRQRIGLMEGE